MVRPATMAALAATMAAALPLEARGVLTCLNWPMIQEPAFTLIPKEEGNSCRETERAKAYACSAVQHRCAEDSFLGERLRRQCPVTCGTCPDPDAYQAVVCYDLLNSSEQKLCKNHSNPIAYCESGDTLRKAMDCTDCAFEGVVLTRPSPAPTDLPTLGPTKSPTLQPTLRPTALPSVQPTSGPSSAPTPLPSHAPSRSPTTLQPVLPPSASPTPLPSSPTPTPMPEAPITAPSQTQAPGTADSPRDSNEVIAWSMPLAAVLLLCVLVFFYRRNKNKNIDKDKNKKETEKEKENFLPARAKGAIRPQECKVFVSHVAADMSSAVMFASKLAEFGFNVFIDKNLRPGREFVDVIIQNINEADAVLLVMDPGFLDRPFCRKEVAIALKKRRLKAPWLDGLKRGVVIPVDVNNEMESLLTNWTRLKQEAAGTSQKELSFQDDIDAIFGFQFIRFKGDETYETIGQIVWKEIQVMLGILEKGNDELMLANPSGSA